MGNEYQELQKKLTIAKKKLVELEKGIAELEEETAPARKQLAMLVQERKYLSLRIEKLEDALAR